MSDSLVKVILGWRKNPVKFVEDNFGVRPDKWQEEALRVFVSEDKARLRIALSACAGPGKSALLAWMAWIFLSCYGERGYHPKGAAISITAENLRDNLWAEIGTWYDKSDFLKHEFEWTKTRVFHRKFQKDWFISARNWSKTASVEQQGRTLSGLHGKYVLALIDESGDIPPSVLRSAEQALSNCKFGRIVQAGNPSSLEGMLYVACVERRSDWHVINITGDPDDPNRSPRIDAEWAANEINHWGRDNPWVKVYILGQFPENSLNQLLSKEEVVAAMSRDLKPEQFAYYQKRIGVDVARFGDDRTVMFPRQGLLAGNPTEMRNARSNEIAMRLFNFKYETNSEIEYIDDTGGYGAGVIDNYLMLGGSCVGVNFSAKADSPRFFNKRAEMWWRMAEWIKRGGCLPYIPEMIKELTAPTYTYVNGKLRIEDKEQIKRRIGVSPDFADALCLTFASVDIQADVYDLYRINKTPKTISDWNPYETCKF